MHKTVTCRTAAGSLLIDADDAASDIKQGLEPNLTLEELKSKVAQRERVHGGIDLLSGLGPAAGSKTRNKRGRSVQVVVTKEGELNWLNHVQKGLWVFYGPVSDTG